MTLGISKGLIVIKLKILYRVKLILIEAKININ